MGPLLPLAPSTVNPRTNIHIVWDTDETKRAWIKTEPTLKHLSTLETECLLKFRARQPPPLTESEGREELGVSCCPILGKILNQDAFSIR
jgi:hypothetical protein